MNLADVMDEVAGRLATIPGLTGRVYSHPVGSLTPPAMVVSYPESMEPHKTYRRGMARMKLPVLYVPGGRVSDKGTRDRLSQICGDSGPMSVIEVLESGTYNAFDVVTVEGIDFDVLTIGGTDYPAALFGLDVVGKGNRS